MTPPVVRRTLWNKRILPVSSIPRYSEETAEKIIRIGRKMIIHWTA